MSVVSINRSILETIFDRGCLDFDSIRDEHEAWCRYCDAKATKGSYGFTLHGHADGCAWVALSELLQVEVIP